MPSAFGRVLRGQRQPPLKRGLDPLNRMLYLRAHENGQVQTEMRRYGSNYVLQNCTVCDIIK